MGLWDAVASAEPYTKLSDQSIFTGRVLFLTPYQQCQSTLGITNSPLNINLSNGTELQPHNYAKNINTPHFWSMHRKRDNFQIIHSVARV